jgi:hypothetical protein
MHGVDINKRPGRRWFNLFFMNRYCGQTQRLLPCGTMFYACHNVAGHSSLPAFSYQEPEERECANVVALREGMLAATALNDARRNADNSFTMPPL